MVTRWLGALIAVLLWPVLAGYTSAFIALLTEVPTVTSAQRAFLLGTTAYFAWHTVIGKPMRLYVFGHEAMHAVATWLSGGQVKAFRVSATGGSVKATKTNLVIAIAPYLIPVYSLLATLLYVVVGWFCEIRTQALWFYAVLGATLAFHWAFTGEFVKTRQPDFVQHGRVLSLTLILWVNLVLVALAVTLVSPPLQFWSYLGEGYRRSVASYAALTHQLFGR